MANGRQSADQGERVRIAEPSKDEMARTPASGKRKKAPSRQRSAMGEYIPPAGGRPLSAQCYPSPGPMDYNLQGVSTGHNAPKHSLHPRLYPLTIPSTPSPNDYNTSRDVCWGANQLLTLKAKDTTWPYDTRKDAHVTDGPGAGHYLRQTGDTGSGVKRSVSARHRAGVNAGYPNPLVQPVDTHGFSTPGPLQFRPVSERGPKHFIAERVSGIDAETLGPGPAGYTLHSPGPCTPFIGEVLHYNVQPDYPPPNTYTLPSPAVEGKTFGLKSKIKSKAFSPPSNAYHPVHPHPTSTALFTLRPLLRATENCELSPGPARYPSTTVDLPAAPQYSCRDQCLPKFPEILLYPEHDIMETPGAGTYNPDREFSNNSNPAHSLGLPLPIKPNANPAPNKYRVDHTHLSTLATSPMYTMRPHVASSAGLKVTGPGPAAYNPRPSTRERFSITPRRGRVKGADGPSPNAYSLEVGTTRNGVHRRGTSASMKGRPTPLQYSGFPSSALVRLQSLS